jgi:hypothetical protein
MARTNQDATFYSNNTFNLAFCLFDDDQTPAVPLDITGASLYWVLTNIDGSGNPDDCPIIVKSIGDGITVTNASGGELTVAIDAEDTSSLTGTFYHELELVDIASNRTVQSTGTITLRKNVINV